MTIADWCERLGGRHIALLLLLVVYSLLGAVVFIALEKENDLEVNNATYTFNREKPARREANRLQIANRLSELARGLADSSVTPSGVRSSIDNAMNWYEEDVYGEDWDELPLPAATPWDIWGGLYYAGTIYTTIGYGNIYAVTVGGRVATMLYALLGIPLTITILNDWGALLYTATILLWNAVLRLFRRPVADDEKEVDATPSNIPLAVAIFMLVGWIALCAAIFWLNEDWTYFEAYYFFFISLTTIGFGDIYPEDRKFTCATFILVLFGLSVVGLALNVIQASLDAAFDEFMAVIDADFKERLEEQEEEMEAQEEDPEQGGPVLPSFGVLRGRQSFGRRLMLSLMGKHKQQMLEDKFEHLANCRNTASQTIGGEFEEKAVQVDMLDSGLGGWKDKSFAEKKSAIATE